MTEHDPLCPQRGIGYLLTTCAYCEVIAKARADEREQIARAIEARAQLRYSWQRGGFRIAARIARNGGNDGA